MRPAHSPWRSEAALRVLLAALVVGFALALLDGRATLRLDHLTYDSLLPLQGHAADPRVVIVAIDDDSLQRLGRWPWSRQRHARLLDRLTESGAAAVGFDVLFPEAQTDNAAADAALTAALQRNGRTILAVAPSKPSNDSPISELLPLPQFATAAAGLGHVDIEIDADGLSRSFYLRAGLGQAHWPAFSLALMQLGDGRLPPPVTNRLGPERAGWTRQDRRYIPFVAGRGAISTVSAADLLSDPATSARVQDKFVLVGSTATGLGDVVSTPVSFSHERMPGVELNAHILSGLLQNSLTEDLDPVWQRVLTAGLALLGAVSLVSSGFAAGVFLVFAAIGLALAISAALLVLADTWFPPASAIVALAAAFPVWGIGTVWRERRLNRALTVRMQHQALHHAATDLPNQHLLEQRLRGLIQPAGDDQRQVVLMIVHIELNEAMSQPMGLANRDALLRLIAERLAENLGDGDMLAQLSGDDFGVLIDPVENEAQALTLCEEMIGLLRRPFELDGSPAYLAPRVGLSRWPHDGPDGHALLRNAYIAVFQARVQKASSACAYSAELAREVEAAAQLERALSSALEHGELEVYYQPQFDGVSARVVGVEALLRWHNPELGLIYPGTFIPVAEHSGLIKRIGRWVLQTACAQVQNWNASGLGPLRLAVNLSPLQFNDAGLENDLEDAIQTSGIDPRVLELEITESALMQDLHETRRIMQLFRRRGVTFAVDDFGTGYSSLSHLQHFPFDRIKIDRSFIHDLGSQDDVREIVLTIIAMAKRLRLEIIAEGVETRDQLNFLIENGCEQLQGFLFSRPVPATEIRRRLEQQVTDASVATRLERG